MRALALWCALGACGRVDFDPRVDTVDAAALGPCTQWSAFSAPVHIPELGSPADDWSLSLTGDGLSGYFYSARGGGVGSFDIWSATRPAIGATWTTPVLVAGINSTAVERVPWISSDGLTIGFSSLRGGGPGGDDLWWSQRPDTQSAFPAPVLMANVNTAGDELGAYLSANGLRLYLSSPGAGIDLYVSERATTADAFGVPVAIPELNSPQTDSDIALSADELEAFIVTQRGGQGDDIYRATRPDLQTPWSTPVRVPELDTAMDDLGIELSRDGTTVFWNYNAVSAGGNAEFYTASRTCLAR